MARKPRKTKSKPSKRKKGKYVSSSHTKSDIGQVYKPDQGVIEHNVTEYQGGGTSKHTVDTYLTDATGQEFHIDSKTTETEIPEKVTTTKGDQDGDTFTDTQRGGLYDNNKKFFGDRINEVYKINDLTPNEKGGKVLDRVRSSHISHGAQTYQQNIGADGTTGSITRYDSPKKMTQTKTKKSGVDKTKQFVSRKYLGGHTDFDTEGKALPTDDTGGWNEYNKSAKDWRKEGVKVISDKRMERMHKRMGNYKQNKTVMGGRRVAGGEDKKQMVETDKSSRENTLVGISNRLATGNEKPTDIYRETWRQRRNKKKKR